MNERRPHIRELDGIRALAVCLVLITHLFGSAAFVPAGMIAGLPAPVRLIVTHGWLGVDLFFVLSGFLITGILLGAKAERDYFRGFYIRRVLRILPLYVVVLSVLIAAYGFQRYATYWTFAIALSANLSSLLHAKVPAGAGPMWSLAVEEQFYLLWPLIVLWLSRRRLAILAAAIVIVEPFVRYHLGTHDMFYPWCRFDGLALGALLATLFSSRSFTAGRKWQLSAGLAVAAAALIAGTAPFGGFAEGRLSTAVRISEGTLFFGALIALLVAFAGTPATAIFRTRAARIVADLSFCLYLIHVPLVEAFESATRTYVPAIQALPPNVLVPLRAIVVFTAAGVIAALSRRYLELPFLRLKAVLLPGNVRTDAREAAFIERPAQ